MPRRGLEKEKCLTYLCAVVDEDLLDCHGISRWKTRYLPMMGYGKPSILM